MKRLRNDSAVDSATITTMIMLPTFLIVFVVVVGSIMWHSYIRTPVTAVVQTYTDLYANLGTNTPARYTSGVPGCDALPSGTPCTVTTIAANAIENIVWVEPNSDPEVICGIADPTATYTIKKYNGSGPDTTIDRTGIRVPTSATPMPANSPVICTAAVKLRPWPFQAGWGPLNNILAGSYDAFGTGFSSGGANANLN